MSKPITPKERVNWRRFADGRPPYVTPSARIMVGRLLDALKEAEADLETEENRLGCVHVRDE